MDNAIPNKSEAKTDLRATGLPSSAQCRPFFLAQAALPFAQGLLARLVDRFEQIVQNTFLPRQNVD